jgi:hypothetical protein
MKRKSIMTELKPNRTVWTVLDSTGRAVAWEYDTKNALALLDAGFDVLAGRLSL